MSWTVKYEQCGCVAHQELQKAGNHEYKRQLRQLLQTMAPLQNIAFAVALVHILLGHLGRTDFVAQRSGFMDGVSYVLMYDDTEYTFKGYPDFTVHFESDTNSNRILVVMGEVQSTREPATQNAIYAVCTLSRTPLKQLLVLTLLKKQVGNN